MAGNDGDAVPPPPPGAYPPPGGFPPPPGQYPPGQYPPGQYPPPGAPGYQVPGYQVPGYQVPGYQVPGYQAPPPAGWWPQQPPAKRGGPLRTALVVVGILLGLLVAAGGAIVAYLEARPLHTPATLAGQPRATGAAAAEVEREMRAEMGDVPKLVTAAYGTGEPEYVLIAGDGAEQDTGEAFDEFAKGFTEDGGRVGGPEVHPGDVKCATLTMEGLRGAFCAWGGSRSDGYTVSFGSRNLGRLAQATVEARSAVHG